jgi:hypothetical protein
VTATISASEHTAVVLDNGITPQTIFYHVARSCPGRGTRWSYRTIHLGCLW